jgi:MSHA biogenesis protein MshG
MRRAVLDFTHQMAAVAESGIPVIAGLKAISEQTENAHLRSAIGRIAGRVEGGRSLADAMGAEEDIFPTLYVKTLAAGEAAGKVPEVLEALARYQQQEADTRGQIKSAMLYPMLVVGSLILATVFMLVFVVPQFAKMFEKFQGELPIPTRILLSVSGAIVNHYVVVIVLAIGAVFGCRALLRVPRVRTALDTLLLRLPVFGNLLLGVSMVRFIELLDLLMRAALPITQSLRVTADSTTNDALRRDVYGMLRSVEGGRSLTEAFSGTRWLTPLVKRMLAVGEQAGRTDQVFSYLRKYYTAQTQRSVKLLSTLIEPVMVASLAAVVLFFALAIFLPMWKLLKIVGTA